jgi:DNA-directed RNA polymerase
MKEVTLSLTKIKTLVRFKQREQSKRSPTRQALAETLASDLAAIIEKSNPPHGLDRVTAQLDAIEVAAVTLIPLLHATGVGPTVRPKKHKRSSAVMLLKLAIGRALHDKLVTKKLLRQNKGAYRRLVQSDNIHKDIWKWRGAKWSPHLYVRAGDWLFKCAMKLRTALRQRVFETDADGFPSTTEAAEEMVRELRAKLVYQHPAYLPTHEPLADWSGLRSGEHWDDGTRITATFVRSASPEMEKVVKAAFKGTMAEHVAGVNALQRVRWRINTAMLPVVERFGTNIGKVNKSLLSDDVITAQYLASGPFRVPINCDFRGRCYGIPHFNFQREDHVRSLFLFEDGQAITDAGIYWLEIHTANCFDEKTDRGNISKRPFHERAEWIRNNSLVIRRTAQNAIATAQWWAEADAPFSFVAACIELAAAWDQRAGFETRLPVCFDGSCNGVQHHAMEMRDEGAGRLVNLMDGGPNDVYQTITDEVFERVRGELNDWTRRTKRIKGKEVTLKPRAEYANFWVDKLNRKIIKRSAMTFAYSATPEGMKEQIIEVYREMRANAEPDEHAARYLARHIMAAAKKVLPEPAKLMEFIRKIAGECADRGQILSWTTPTGFPWMNLYYKPTIETIHLETLGECVRHAVADGHNGVVRKRKCMDAASPNFTHAMDAAHLIKVVNAAAAEGIQVGTIHDCFACIAPRAPGLRRIIREQFARLHSRDHLADLRAAAGSNEPLPIRGSLDPWCVLRSEYLFS